MSDLASLSPIDLASAPLRANGEPFQGGNHTVLAIAAATGGYRARTWLTFHQALAAGGAVRKGQHGTRVRLVSGGAEDDEGQRRGAYTKTYVVFNAEQCDGLPPALLR